MRLPLFYSTKSVSAILVALALSACGGGGGSSSVATETGRLIASPVENITFKTATLNGVTSASGEFSYQAGETITFSIGAITFGPVPARPVITIQDLAGGDTNSNTFKNMLSLLQTLDVDGEASNTLKISDVAKSSATSAVNFDSQPSDFYTLPEVAFVLSDAGQVTTPNEFKDAADAIAKYNEYIDAQYSINFNGKTGVTTFQSFDDGCSYSTGPVFTFEQASYSIAGNSGTSSNLVNGQCTLSPQTYVEVTDTLNGSSGVRFACSEYPICKPSDFNKVLDIGAGKTQVNTYDFVDNILTFVRKNSDGSESSKTIIKIQ